ncbi:MAG: prepilin peptidase [Blastocatellia bacterium AA13]|nr:MAG: prepilin peptidase [Blastocatellia bacterium AA13]
MPPQFIGFSVFLFGLIVGSFLNVVIARVPNRESIVLPPSHCPSCLASIKPYDNVPILSYMILGGRCRSCRVHISFIYPAVEAMVGIVYLLLYLLDGLTLAFLGDVVFVSLILPLVFIDYRHKILPNVITYPGFIVLLALRVLAPLPVPLNATEHIASAMISSPIWTHRLLGALLGALAGGGSLWLVGWLYLVIRKVEGMGLGDAKMMAMVGAFLGWELTFLTIFVASLMGSIVGVLAMLVRGESLRMEIPFGVFLGPSAIIALLAGRELIGWYASLFN